MLLSFSIVLFYNVMMTGGPKPVLVSSYKSPNSTGASGGTTTTGTFTFVAGDTLVAADYGCSSAGCGSATAKPNFAGVTGPGIGTCALIGGSRSGIGQVTVSFIGTEMWWCPITASGTNVTVTAHWASTCVYCSFALISVHGLSGSPDSGNGNTKYNGSQAAVNVATARGTDGHYSIVVFSELTTTDVTLGRGESLIFDDFDNTGWIMSYKISNSSSAIASGNIQMGGAGAWNASAAALHAP